MTIITLRHILQDSAAISQISVSDCKELRGTRGALWGALSPVARRLEALDVSGTQMQSLPLDELMTQCPCLEELVADRCEALEIPRSFRTERLPFAKVAPKLRLLRLDGARSFPIELLRLLFTRGVPLLVLSVNHVLPHTQLSALYGPGLPELEHLALSGQNLTDDHFREMIIDILRASLITLDLSKCSNLTGHTLQLAHCFPRLTKVDLSGTRFTASAAGILVRVAPQLVYLNLSGCRSIPDRAMRREPLEYIRRLRSPT
jgi:hypothetical protein